MNTLSFFRVGVSRLQPGTRMEVNGITIQRDENYPDSYEVAGFKWTLNGGINEYLDLVTLYNHDLSFGGLPCKTEE